MFNNNNETNDDDDFFVPITSSSSKSSLANLFGANSSNRQDSKSALTYTPPKQPKNQLTPLQKPPKKLVSMKTITLSRLIDNSYSVIGKFGIAIISDQVNADLIIYKSKQNILSNTKLSAHFQYKQINEIVLSFTDDQSETWMVVFDSLNDKMEFIAELSKHATESSQIASQEAQETCEDIYNRRLVAEKPEEEQNQLFQDDVRTRADILGRISKMGLSILPQTQDSLSSNASSTIKLDRDFSESEPEEVIRTTKMRKIRARHSESSIETMDLVPKSPNQFKQFGVGHQLMDPLNIYFSENRTHNSEVRMNLSQLSNKIDSLLSELKPQASLGSLSDRELFERRIIDLERRLEHGLGASTSQPDLLEKKYHELQKENAHNILKHDEIVTSLRAEIEHLKNALESRHASWDKEVMSLEEEKSKLIGINDSLLIKIAELQSLLDCERTKMHEFTTKKADDEDLAILHHEELDKQQKQNVYLQQSLDTINDNYKELELKFSQVIQAKTRDEDVFSEIVKQSMNSMYQNVLSDCIESTTNLDVRDLKKFMQKHLKFTTFSIIDQFSKYHKDSESGQTSSVSSVSPEFEVTV